MIKLIVFDLWKTLAYHKVPYSTTTKVLKTFNLNIPKEKFTKIFVSSFETKVWHSKYAAYKNLCLNIQIKATPKNIGIIKKIRDTAERQSRLYSHSIPLLKKLKALGLKIALLSNTGAFVLPYIRKTPILQYIDYPVFSCQVGLMKPDLKIYKKLLSVTKCKPTETIMVGDRIDDDVIPPKKLGMQAIHFTNYQDLKRDLKKYNIYL